MILLQVPLFCLYRFRRPDARGMHHNSQEYHGSGVSPLTWVSLVLTKFNNLGVQLSSVFHLTRDPDQPGYEYLGVRITAVNRSKKDTFVIGAQGIDAINAAYPVPPLTNVDANFQAMAAATPDFTASCDGQSVLCSANISLYNPNSQSFSDAESLPPQGSGYVVLMLMVPTGWQQIQVTYLPTFVQDKTLTFILNAADVIRG